MTVSNSNRTAGPFVGNGSAATFPFNFKIFSASDIVVVRSDGISDSTLAPNSDYTIQVSTDQESNAGGSITLKVPLATGYTLVITSDISELQPISITNQGGFYPRVIENALDRVTILIQQLRGLMNRSLKFPLSDISANTQLPPRSARANNLLSFDANGDPVAVAASSQSATALQLALAGQSGPSLIGFAQAAGVTRSLLSKIRETISLADYGAVGDGVADDTAAVQLALNSAPKNSSIMLVGTSGGSRFRIGNISVPPYVSLAGRGETFGMTDLYDSSSYSTAGATFLLNTGATIKMGNGSALVNAHIFPYGMEFPQRSSASWAGTAITINRGVQMNTVDVLLENLLICGFAQAISGYWCPRLICNNINFDCNNGIKVETAGDPIRFFNCHGWPFATLAGTVITDAGARDRRTGNGFEFITNADAGKITNCFAFGYTIGFKVTAANGIVFLNCGSDDYNLFPPLTSTGWDISGSCGLTSLISCQSVAHQFGVSMNAADDTNILQVVGGLYGSNASENIHLVKGSVTIGGGTNFGAAMRAVGMFGATNRLILDGAIFQGLTNEVVLNNASSPHVYIGDGNLTQDITCPMYNGQTIENQVASGASVTLPLSGDNITVIGTTNIFGFTGGWPGRTVHLRFNGVLTLSDSAGMQLAGNYTTAINSVLTLRFTSANQCYEVSRSTN